MATIQAITNNNLPYKSDSKVVGVILHGIFLLLMVVFLAPLVLVFMASITDETSLIQYGFSFIPRKFSFLAYEYVLGTSGQLLQSYLVSVFITVVGSLTSILVMAMLAYPLSRKDFRLRGAFSLLIVVPILFNGGMVPWYMIYSSMLHWKDTLLVLIFPLLVTPFYVVMMRTFFHVNLPDSIIESAKIDGASEYRIFFSIVLKLSTPVLATVGLFNTLAYWNDWFTALMFISKNELIPVQFLLYRIQSSLTFLITLNQSTGQGSLTLSQLPNMSARMAMCIITIGPVILSYPFFQRYFIRGLMIGAIKG